MRHPDGRRPVCTRAVKAQGTFCNSLDLGLTVSEVRSSVGSRVTESLGSALVNLSNSTES